MFGKAYGWNQREVDETDSYTLDWLIAIQGVEAEIQQEETDKRTREMKASQARASRPRRR